MTLSLTPYFDSYVLKKNNMDNLKIDSIWMNKIYSHRCKVISIEEDRIKTSCIDCEYEVVEFWDTMIFFEKYFYLGDS